MCGVRGSLQVITPFRKLILCAENRKEMEDWIGALKSVQKWEIHEVGQPWARGVESPEVGSSGAGWGVKEGGPEGADGAGCAPQATQFNMEHFSGMHNWYACSHARPTFCNVCREALSGVTSHGLSCEGQHPGGGDMGRCPRPRGWGPSSLFLLFLPSVQVQGPQALRRARHQQLQVDHAGLHRHGNHRGRGRGEPAGGSSRQGHLPRVVARG